MPIGIVLFIYAERKSALRLQGFVSPRLLPQLVGNVDYFRRTVRFGLRLTALALAFVSLAQPRWGYTFEDVKRKGIDLLIAVDTSRSMLSNDVQPNRLERVKLATQDLITQLQGDRVGLIAFAGRAFVQAPLTIDYDAVVEAINDLDTKTIPEGGTNISEAIRLAQRTYGKSAVGNRALVIFTDGEELSGDALDAAKAATDAGIRIFSVGVGTPEGSLIPIASEDGGNGFVKDAQGQVVKSKLDESRLRQIAQIAGGFYLHLQNGPRTMQQLYSEGLAKMNAGEIDVRLSRRPIERYAWPLGAALLALSTSMLIGERKSVRRRRRLAAPITAAAPVAAFWLLSASISWGSATGLELYRDGKYADAYQSFTEDLKKNPDSTARDRIQFDAGTAAYKMRDYNKATEAFSQALLTRDRGLQEYSHYNMGRTLEERADMAKSDENALKDLTNAQSHYEDTLKLDPHNKAAQANLEEVKKKIERLKNRRKQPTPPPQNKPQKNNKQEKQSQDQNQQQQQQQQSSAQNKNDQRQQQSQNQQQQQQQTQNNAGANKDQKRDQAQAKNEPRKKNESKGESPTPSPGNGQSSASPSPSPGEGQQNRAQQTPSENNPPEASPSPGEGESPTPTPGEGEGEGSGETSPAPSPTESPRKKFAGEIKGATDDRTPKPDEHAAVAEAEPEKEGEMTERQAEALLHSMKDEEARVQLEERRVARRVYNDW